MALKRARTDEDCSVTCVVRRVDVIDLTLDDTPPPPASLPTPPPSPPATAAEEDVLDLDALWAPTQQDGELDPTEVFPTELWLLILAHLFADEAPRYAIAYTGDETTVKALYPGTRTNRRTGGADPDCFGPMRLARVNTYFRDALSMNFEPVRRFYATMFAVRSVPRTVVSTDPSRFLELFYDHDRVRAVLPILKKAFDFDPFTCNRLAKAFDHYHVTWEDA
jgi:hypothetical protein